MNARTSRVGWKHHLYVALAIAGLIATWTQGMAYLGGSFIDANIEFWKQALTTPASTFIVVDILTLVAVVTLWMFAECRRLGIRMHWAWIYLLGNTFVAVCFFFPLFMAHRERVLAARGETGGLLQGADWLAVIFVVGTAAAGYAYSLTHIPA